MALFWSLLGCLLASSAVAGVMTHEELVKRYPTPYIVGEKETPTPVWPVYRQDATENRLVGYVFESIDFAPIPGFAGVPFNLLITLDPLGRFLDVKVLSQHEPVFVDGLGEAPLNTFIDQYSGLSLKQNMRIVTGSHGAKNNSDESAQLDGITKATASVHIINQTVLSSALRVARKKLGFAEGRDPELMSRIKLDIFEPRTFQELTAARLIQHIILKNADVDKQFSGTIGQGLDTDSAAHPQDTFIDLSIAYVSVPSIGRNLLGETAWKKLQDRLGPGDQAILAMWKGRYDIIGENFIRGSISDRIILKQDKFPIEMKDLNMDLELKSDPGLDSGVKVAVFKVNSQAGLDPAIPLEFVLPITRYKGIIFPEKITRNFTFKFELPA
ncbi:MAG: 4Fe-4S binding protein, partial [Gallionella sp.]